MIKRFFFAAAAALLAGVPSASATPEPSPFAGMDEGHLTLVRQAFANGVPVVINPAPCSKGMMGYYNGSVIGLCTGDRGWDAENLDTLRHEAHHMVQDCLVDGRPDFQFPGNKTLFSNPIDFALSTGALTAREIDEIYMTYGSMGLSQADILIEVEAWAVGAIIDPYNIADALNRYCSSAK